MEFESQFGEEFRLGLTNNGHLALFKRGTAGPRLILKSRTIEQASEKLIELGYKLLRKRVDHG